VPYIIYIDDVTNTVRRKFGNFWNRPCI